MDETPRNAPPRATGGHIRFYYLRILLDCAVVLALPKLRSLLEAGG